MTAGGSPRSRSPQIPPTLEMVHHADQEIIYTLGSFQEQLFPTLRGGDSALAAFLSKWNSFNDTIQSCSESLRAETLERLLAFSNMVASVTGGLAQALSLSEKLLDEVSTVVDESILADTPTARAPSQVTPYIKLTSKWLMANVHNPYPSPEVRTSIATQTNSSKKDVDNWFLDARKRIGWNDMRRKHFDNKRVGIVDAAKRFFLSADPSRPLPPIVESEFASVQLRAQELYSNKFEESPLAARLDMSIINAKTGAKAGVGGNNSRRDLTPPAAKAARHYPSPQPSPAGSFQSLSSSPLPPFSELPSTTSKRRASVLSDVEEQKQRPLKRRRSSKVDQSCSPSLTLQRPAGFISSEACLPSPVSSTFDKTELHPPPHYPTHIAPVSHKRKRRLSDPEGLPSPKRPRAPSMSSRIQTVSNPLPMSQPTTDEFDWDQLLDFSTLPPPGSLLSPEDIPGPIDISLFEFPVWEQHGYGSFNPSPSQEPIIASSSSSTLNLGAIDDFPTPSTNPLAEDFPLFNWNTYGSSEPDCPAEPISTKANGLYILPNISSDFAPLADQWTAPIPLSATDGCLPTFPVPTQLTPQEVLAQAVPEPTITTVPKSALEVKEEQLRALQAQVAALTAEIAAAS